MKKNDTILLSVCVRTHNQERFIGEALDSVLRQHTTFPFEIIISDDASEDGTWECPECHHKGNKGKFCEECGHKRDGE